LFRRYSSEAGELGVLLVDCPEPLSFSDVAENLHSESSSVLEQTDLLVLRPPVDIPIEDSSTLYEHLGAFRDRVPRAAIHLLHSHAFSIRISANLNNSVESRELDTDFLFWLRQEELSDFILSSGALYPKQEGLAYRAPSGKHYQSFVRVGNIQTSAAVVDAVFFWMLPHLRGKTGILTETWSISSTAFNAAFRLNRYHPAGSTFRVGMLSSYQDSVSELHSDTRQALQRVAAPDSRTLVLLSAVATGKSLARLRETLAERAVSATVPAPESEPSAKPASWAS